MPALRRPLTLLFACVLALLPALTASASTADDLEAAEQRLTEARTAANEARALAYQAEVDLEQTEDRIGEIEQTITGLKARAAELRDVVRKRALYAYTHASNNIDTVIGSEDPVTAARGRTLIDISNRKDNNAVKRLAAINSDLRDETLQLHAEESRQRTAADQLAARNKDFQARLTEAQTQRQLVRDLLDRAFGGSAAKLVMQALAAKRASPEELLEIRRLIDGRGESNAAARGEVRDERD